MPASQIRSTVVALMSVVIVTGATAEITPFDDYAEWSAAAGSHETITFTELGPPTVMVTDQYEEIGLTVDPSESLATLSSGSFPADGVGARTLGPGDGLWIDLTQPIEDFAIEMPAATVVRIYDGDLLIDQRDYFAGFGGLTSSVPFDRVYLATGTAVSLDTIHLSTIPAPTALALLALGGFVPVRRRRD